MQSSNVGFLLLFCLSVVYANIQHFDCFERYDTGVGRAYFESYVWIASNRTCAKFAYGGVLGNRNRFSTSEECSHLCHDAVLRHQLDFKSTRQYTAMNRLFESAKIELNIENVSDGYFRLIVQPLGKVLSIINRAGKTGIGLQESNNNQTQHWDIIPTGDKDYYRIKTRTKPIGSFDYMFLQAVNNGTIYADIDRRDNTYLGQQWRLA